MNKSGQGLVESIFILALGAALLLLIGAVGYAGFARAWIGYQSDQALFCLAEGRPAFDCQTRALRAMRAYLPSPLSIRLETLGPTKWASHVEMKWRETKFHQNRVLRGDYSLWR